MKIDFHLHGTFKACENVQFTNIHFFTCSYACMYACIYAHVYIRLFQDILKTSQINNMLDYNEESNCNW